MSNALAVSEFTKLADFISDLYEKTREANIRFAWETGRHIVQVEQKGAVRAEYGSSLLPRLSEELIRRHGAGSGFSSKNLARMRQFYQRYPILSHATKLTWSDHVELLSVKNERARLRLEKRIASSGGLKRDDLRALVKKETGYERPAPDLPPLVRPTDLKFNTFRLAKPEIAALRKVPRGQVLIDCGFFAYLPVEKGTFPGLITGTPAWTYAVTVLRVVDGDTVVVVFTTLGSDKVHEEKFRLRGINTPELGTPEGEKAKKYVEKLLPAGSTIVVKTQKSTDPHGRFVVDLFLKDPSLACPVHKPGQAKTLPRLPGDQPGAGAEGVSTKKPNSTPEEIILGGTYLNQELLNEGYAVRMAE
jgi:endonuclease YncB( thermonuclease family)